VQTETRFWRIWSDLLKITDLLKIRAGTKILELLLQKYFGLPCKMLHFSRLMDFSSNCKYILFTIELHFSETANTSLVQDACHNFYNKLSALIFLNRLGKAGFEIPIYM